MTEIKRAFAILKKYQMVEFLDVFDEQLENTRIMIYPCINLVADAGGCKRAAWQFF